jgi:hypothetical protein
MKKWERHDMNLDTVVKQGSQPWEPSSDAHDLVALHEYDVPTVGVFVLGSDRVLFTIIGSPDDRVTVWAYTSLTEQDDLPSRRFGSVAELGQAVDARFVGRQAVLAIADDLQIWRWTSIDVRHGVMQSATEFLSQVRESLESAKEPDAEFEVKLAGVAAARAELITA